MTNATFVLASNNQKKLHELQYRLATSIDLVTQGSMNVTEAEETGLTFIENALLKARNACQHTGLPAIADDSGLEVDFLDGAPGIYSSRYSGLDASDQDNNNKLLAALNGIPEAQRTARFQCVIVMLRHAEDPVPIICQGSWEGVILTEPEGSNGFGYDPLFYVPALKLAAAQLDAETKNRISHRAQAVSQLITKLL